MKLEELREIASKRTKGEWDWSENNLRCPSKGFTCDCGIDTVDARFIALAANTYDQLLKVAECAKLLKKELDECDGPIDGSRLLGIALEELEK